MFICTDEPQFYEIQLTPAEYDECYLRLYSGLYSEKIYIKLGGCEELYDLVFSYIRDHQE